MAFDVVLMEENKEATEITRKLGFEKIFFKNDIKKLGILEVKDYNDKRKLIENNSLNILLNPHLVTNKDSLHFRNSGMDQIICSLMNKNGIAMAFTLDKINNHVEIGRIMQNIRLCRKYKVKMLFFTFSDNIYGLRAKLDIIAFLQVLGMTPNEAKEALEGLKEFIQ